jgi:hypothetical protein
MHVHSCPPARLARILGILVLASVAPVLQACGYDDDHHHHGGYHGPYYAPPPPPGGPGPSTAGPPTDAESEPNDTVATADFMPLNHAAQGTVAAPGDVDVWSFDAVSGEVIRIDLHASRVDQPGWDGACNAPRLTLIDRDGTTKLLEHDLSGNFSLGWSGGRHDLDVPAFRIPASGEYFVQVTQDDPVAAGGEYALWVRAAGVASLVLEAEAVGATGVNETPATAQAIGDPGSGTRTVLGFFVDGEADVYSFAVSAPSALSFEITAYRNGVFRADDDYVDPVLELVASDGVTVLDANDDAYFRDAALSYAVTMPGTYFLRVVESAGSAGDGAYYLAYRRTPLGSVTEGEPNDVAAQADAISYGQVRAGTTSAADPDLWRFTGTAGDMVEVWFFERENRQGAVADVTFDLLLSDGATVLSADRDDGPGDLHVLRAILPTSGTFHVRALGAAAVTPYALRLLRARSAQRETEPNDTQPTADPLDGSGRAAGTIGAGGDADFFRFAVAAGELVTLSCYAEQQVPPGSDGARFLSGHGSTLRPVFTVFDAGGGVVGSSVFTPPALCTTTESVTDGLPCVTVTFVAPTSGTYAVAVEDEAGAFGPTATYVVERK